MSKRALIISNIILLLVIIAGVIRYFGIITYEKSAIDAATAEMFKPQTHIGFWNKVGSRLEVKVLYADGNVRYIGVPDTGGTFGGIDPGVVNLSIETPNSKATLNNLSLIKNGKVTFNIHEDRFEQTECL
jgi:hypothetical protein